ncbi:FAD-binding domain-containing protein [Methylobacterium indicum]|uniref:FAD-binding domain-containing protein n=1 Tax=Methylobacterium indicum TaxID=1775910 RepID=UPI002434EEB5|nr:FAD-binding domain-containing protein [Methylobacterium indicum]
MPHPVMTRAAGLDALASFLAGSGADYAATRNTDPGRDDAPTTSCLSPYLRRRLLTEEEVARAALSAFGERGADKFVSEVFWRTYFKGHLETHPEAWARYRAGRDAARARLADEPGLHRTHDRAVAGETGLDGFDAWATQLVEQGFLHNHARMWFASIWIFTLRLPWELGAAFFLRHLLDGDPASNTLSWRWVAGLHTRGKPYLARRDNIREFTRGRHDPAGLNEDAASLAEEIPPREVPLAHADTAPDGPVALLLHLDDLAPETLPLGNARVTRVAGLLASDEEASDTVRAADAAAMADALARAAAHFGCPVEPVRDGWAGGLPVVTPWAPVGPSAEALPAGCRRIRRDWDERAWPLSNRGYSRLRGAIPKVMAP